MRRVLACVLVLSLVIPLAACGDVIKKTDTETSIHDQVMARGSIRCGYTEFPPYFIKNADGTLGGVVYDVMQEAGKRLSLKIDYVTQVGWSTVVEDLRQRKIDMACSYFWQNSTRGRLVPPSHPIMYDQLWVFQRGSDARVIDDYAKLNDEQYTFAGVDGGAENKAMDVRVPKARRFMLPELSSTTDFFELVATGKADFLVVDANTAERYMTGNPGKIKRLPVAQPFHVFPGVMLLPPNDPQFKSMIDVTLQEIDSDGALDAILEKYGMQGKVSRNVYFK